MHKFWALLKPSEDLTISAKERYVDSFRLYGSSADGAQIQVLKSAVQKGAERLDEQARQLERYAVRTITSMPIDFSATRQMQGSLR